MSDLWERLRAAKSRAEAPVPPPESPAGTDPAPLGWHWVAPMVAERAFRFPLEARFWQTIGADLDAADWDQLLCFDTETTGLSGGAGTVVFLAGWARLVPTGGVPDVEVRQWFLRDHPGETDWIAAVDAALGPARGLVSFNGASFDLPLLRSRWSLAGKTFPPRPHRDDLHPSRRLWKRLLPSCRLGQIEAAVLGVERVDDVPGALVPALWYDYLRAGANWDFVTPLEGVLRHHAQDVYSLLCLDLLLVALRKEPNSDRWRASFSAPPTRHPLARPAPIGLLHPDLPRPVFVDFWGLLRLQDQESADRSLEAAWSTEGGETIGLAWADRLKRQRRPEALAVWQVLWEDCRSYTALVEWVKWLEHRERSAAARAKALVLIDEALTAPFLPRAWREGLERRRLRLSRSPSSEAP